MILKEGLLKRQSNLILNTYLDLLSTRLLKKLHFCVLDSYMFNIVIIFKRLRAYPFIFLFKLLS